MGLGVGGRGLPPTSGWPTLGAGEYVGAEAKSGVWSWGVSPDPQPQTPPPLFGHDFLGVKTQNLVKIGMQNVVKTVPKIAVSTGDSAKDGHDF